MMALSVAYQAERTNVEANDLPTLVIRTLRLIVGRIIKQRCEGSEVSEGYIERHLLLTSTITEASRALIEAYELDISYEFIANPKVGRVPAKMRLQKAGQSGTGKSGWLISLADVDRWANSYGLNVEEITHLRIVPHEESFTTFTTFTGEGLQRGTLLTPHAFLLPSRPSRLRVTLLR